MSDPRAPADAAAPGEGPAPALMTPASSSRGEGRTPPPDSPLPQESSALASLHGPPAAGASAGPLRSPRASPPGHAATLFPGRSVDTGDTWSEEPRAAPTFASIGAEIPGRYDAAEGEELGRGGLGRVLVAYDTHLGREIALKELLGQGQGGRFLREARVTAQLEHPNIVPVYELGRRADGTLYYTMKRVRGRTLAAALGAADTIADRLALLGHFVSTCNAVAYAHSRGVVHRDLKPQNIMVGEFGETVLLDWGLAKVRGQSDPRGGDLEREVQHLREAEVHRTLQGATIGTPAYMSPEQASGRIEDIDERSDVWSLGAVLFEILTGVPPFVGRTPTETLAKVLHEPVPNADEAPEELANVCAKALQRDPAERYQTAKELADEIAAWQVGRRVTAHSYTLWEGITRFVTRNRVTVGALAVMSLLVSAVVGAVTGHILRERDRAVLAEHTTRAALGHTLTDRAITALRAHDDTSAWALAATSLAVAETPEARGAFVAAASGWLPELVWKDNVGERCGAVAYAPDGASLAVAARSGIWVRRMGQLHRLDLQGDAALAVAFSDAAHVVAAHASGSLVLWAPPGETLDRLGSDREGIRTLLALPDDRVATGGWNGIVQVWDLARRRILLRLGGHSAAIDALAATPDGRMLAAAAQDHTIRVWDLTQVSTMTTLPDAGLALAFSPDGKRLAVGGDGRVRVWDLTSRDRIAEMEGPTGEITGLAWSANGLLAASATDGSVTVWDGETMVGRIPTFGAARGVAFSPDGRRLAAVAGEGELLEWSLPPRTKYAHSTAVVGVGFSDDGHLRTVGEDARTWDLATGAASTRRLPIEDARLAAVTPEGLVVTGEETWWIPDNGEPERWETASRVNAVGGGEGKIALGFGEVVQLRTAEGVATSAPLGATVLGVASRGSQTFAALADGTVRILDGVVPGASTRMPGHSIGALALSPDALLLASGEDRGPIYLWSLPQLRAERTLEGHTDGPVISAFSPDGLLATGGGDGTIRVWDSQGRERAVVPGHTNAVRAVAFSPSGKLATGGADRVAAVWHLEALGVRAEQAIAEAERRFGVVVAEGEVRKGE